MSNLDLSEQMMQPTTTWREMEEGQARFVLPARPNKTAKVFYNPRMTLNRDIAILFANCHFPPDMQLHICDPMAASGIRTARYLLETKNVLHVLSADSLKESVEATTRTVILNGISNRVSILESEANSLLLNHVTQRFDLLDLDPFGSPAPFFDNALRATRDGGVIAATATDMGLLTGARVAACVRKYGVRPISSEFAKEMAVRNLAACLETVAGRLGLGIEIVFSHASDHYARIYAEVRKGTRAANAATRFLGFLEYCPGCLERNTHNRLDTIRTACTECGSKTRVGGPVWVGPLWNLHTVNEMIERTPALHSTHLSEVQNLLTCIAQEHQGPAFHYTTEAFSQRLRLKPPSMKNIIDRLRAAGFVATRTHFTPTGFRTNARHHQVASAFQDLADEA